MAVSEHFNRTVKHTKNHTGAPPAALSGLRISKIILNQLMYVDFFTILCNFFHKLSPYFFAK
jgi:hypothetical protein